MTLPSPPAKEPAATARANPQPAPPPPPARRDIDYAALDARLKRLAQQRPVVGLAVGIVENGRITFLSGYGETVAGSGEKVTADTVFRWASVSKGVAGTMVAKLAEQGKVKLDAPVVNYAPGLKLPAGNEYRASDTDARATGTTYQDAVRQQLFGPLGMTSATMTREGLVSARSWARPHSV